MATQDSQRGTAEVLRQLPYLLNDNSQVQGPWFNSVDWPQRSWVPQAERLGLRYVAHVWQPHPEDELGLLLRHNPSQASLSCSFLAAWPMRLTGCASASDWRRSE